jgi:hypothetical protein
MSLHIPEILLMAMHLKNFLQIHPGNILREVRKDRMMMAMVSRIIPLMTLMLLNLQVDARIRMLR